MFQHESSFLKFYNFPEQRKSQIKANLKYIGKQIKEPSTVRLGKLFYMPKMLLSIWVGNFWSTKLKDSKRFCSVLVCFHLLVSDVSSSTQEGMEWLFWGLEVVQDCVIILLSCTIPVCRHHCRSTSLCRYLLF